MAANASPAKRRDDRVHSAVYHKRDPRVNGIIRRHQKSDIISLYDIECMMLFRVEQANMQFDMMQNYRPYISFSGTADGVFLPRKLGLLFPNACDQLDFRDDYPVPVSLAYALSDPEISVLAGNGLFNNDWSCQGRIIGSVLEIPCKVDYYAVARTPLTFVEIQDRLSIRTSTMKTGYKTLVAAFLPYSAQKHNLEQHPVLRDGLPFSMTQSEVRRRTQHEGQPAGFSLEEQNRTRAQGASFVEEAQARIRQRLHAEMERSDVLGTSAGRSESDAAATAKQVANAVKAVRERAAQERQRALDESREAGTMVRIADLDAKLEDMRTRMVYAGGGEIPVEAPPLAAEPLVPPSPPDMRSGAMTEPIQSEDAASRAAVLDANIHAAALNADAVADKTAKDLKTRRDRIAARRASRNAQATHAARVNEAMEKAADAKPVAGDNEKQESRTASSAGMPQDASGDILSGNVDIDEVIRGIGM